MLIKNQIRFILPLGFLIFLVGCQNPSKEESENPKSVPQKEKMLEERFVKNDSAFLDMIQKEVIVENEEKKYISNVEKLESVQLIYRDSTSIHYKDVIDGKEIDFKLSIKDFKKSKHKINYKTYENKKHKDCELIDDKLPYGGYYGCPKTEVDNISIVINNSSIHLQDALNDIYNIDFSNKKYWEHFYPNPSLKYDTTNEVFYLYIYGGNAADTYFGKFTFDDEKYIKRYVLDYIQLSKTGSFRNNFKGF